MLGARLDGATAKTRNLSEVRLRSHQILTGGEDFATERCPYKHVDLANDVHVLMEGGVDAKFAPIAWTRERNGTRILYLGPDAKSDFDQVSYFRIIANGIFWTVRREIPGAGTRIHRTWMPNAYPSSFAVGFSSGLNFCFDPIKGAVAYAWDGDYVDLWPTIAAKTPRDVIVQGRIFYSASEKKGFQSDKGAATSVQFHGYRLEANIPRFRYSINQAVVEETITPKSDRSGLIRRFRMETSGEDLWFEPEDARQVTVHHGAASWVEGRLRIPARSVIEFGISTDR